VFCSLPNAYSSHSYLTAAAATVAVYAFMQAFAALQAQNLNPTPEQLYGVLQYHFCPSPDNSVKGLLVSRRAAGHGSTLVRALRHCCLVLKGP
jgi:hypothetical protein